MGSDYFRTKFSMNFLRLFAVLNVLANALNMQRFGIVERCGEKITEFATRSRLECSILIARSTTERGFRWDRKTSVCNEYQSNEGEISRKCWHRLPVRICNIISHNYQSFTGRIVWVSNRKNSILPDSFQHTCDNKDNECVDTNIIDNSHKSRGLRWNHGTIQGFCFQ